LCSKAFRVGCAHEKRYVFSGLRQAATEVASHRARTHH
jgi:hypothetical protein